jgi:hypothetical protein
MGLSDPEHQFSRLAGERVAQDTLSSPKSLTKTSEGYPLKAGQMRRDKKERIVLLCGGSPSEV